MLNFTISPQTKIHKKGKTAEDAGSLTFQLSLQESLDFTAFSLFVSKKKFRTEFDEISETVDDG